MGSLPSLADIDGAFSCFAALSGYLLSGLDALCAAAGNIGTPNPKHNAKTTRVQARAWLRILTHVGARIMS
jgi:hypothetical protein